MTATTDEETTEVSVGLAITRREQLAAAPVGTVIQVTQEPSVQFVKQDDGLWMQPGVGRGRDNHWFSIDGRNSVVSVPGAAAPAAPAVEVGVGDTITSRAMYEALPVGAVVHSTSTNTDYIKVGEAHFQGPGGRRRALSQMSFRGNLVVASLPEPSPEVEVEAEVEVPPMPEFSLPVGETFDHYRRRFRDSVLAQAARSSVGRDPVVKALEALGANCPPVVGQHVATDQSWTYDSLPCGTVVEHRGSSVSLWGNLESEGWTRLVGQAPAYFSGYFQVASGPTVVEAEDREPTEEDARRIVRFKQRAWMLGNQVKREQGYCGDYERAMRMADIDGGLGHGAYWVSASECAALPVGTALRAEARNGTVLVLRDDDATNPAKVRRLAGTIPGTWAQVMQVLCLPDPDGVVKIPIHSTTEMDSMPQATRIEDAGGSFWVKTEGGRWVLNGSGTHSYRSVDFSLSTLYYVVR